MLFAHLPSPQLLSLAVPQLHCQSNMAFTHSLTVTWLQKEPRPRSGGTYRPPAEGCHRGWQGIPPRMAASQIWQEAPMPMVGFLISLPSPRFLGHQKAHLPISGSDMLDNLAQTLAKL